MYGTEETRGISKLAVLNPAGGHQNQATPQEERLQSDIILDTEKRSWIIKKNGFGIAIQKRKGSNTVLHLPKNLNGRRKTTKHPQFGAHLKWGEGASYTIENLGNKEQIKIYNELVRIATQSIYAGQNSSLPVIIFGIILVNNLNICESMLMDR